MSHTKEIMNDAFLKVSKFEFKNPEYFNKFLKNNSSGFKKYILRFFYFYFLRYRIFRNYISPFFQKNRFGLIKEINLNPERFDKIYEILHDSLSKETFDWYIKNRIAQATLDNLSINVFPSSIKENDFITLENSLKEVKKGVYEIENYNVRGDKFGLICTFMINQYKYYDIIKPEKDDIVIDGGGYVGDTALWFSKHIGEDGKVFCFEPFDSNFAVLMENIKNNNIKNIIPEQFGLWGNKTILKINGTSSGAFIDKTGFNIHVVSIDEFVKNNKLQKINFIKLDIEGAELNALEGAKETIKKFKPKLAICVYHKKKDIIEIPEYIMRLVPEYKIMLKSNSFNFLETVMYASILNK